MQNIRLTVAYLTTIRHVIIHVFFLLMKRLDTTLKNVYFLQSIAAQVGMLIQQPTTTTQGCQVRVKISIQLPQKVAQFNIPTEFMLGY